LRMRTLYGGGAVGRCGEAWSGRDDQNFGSFAASASINQASVPASLNIQVAIKQILVQCWHGGASPADPVSSDYNVDRFLKGDAESV
jgi:hypothetical protein